MRLHSLFVAFIVAAIVGCHQPAFIVAQRVPQRPVADGPSGGNSNSTKSSTKSSTEATIPVPTRPPAPLAAPSAVQSDGADGADGTDGTDGADGAEMADSSSGDVKIRFQFQESSWEDVIPWFAEQAGYSLQPIGDWPEGMFYLKDESEYTVMEALDQLNHALRMRNPPFTLIRNRNMLILSRLEDANFPDDLIETVAPEDLDQRGRYETINCIFDLGDLDVETMYDELSPLIGSNNQSHFALFAAANQIRVRETGGALRNIRDVIEIARKRAIDSDLSLRVYKLQHVDAETFMLIARGLLGMDVGSDATEDGSLTISREPFGDRLFIRGTTPMHRRFDEAAVFVDVEADDFGGVQIAKQSFKTYPVLGDQELAFDLLETVLEGRGAKMQQNKLTGSITVLGRPEDHAAVVEAMAAIESEGGESFEIITVHNGDASELMIAVQSLLRQTTASVTDLAVPSGPVIMANSLLNQILVRGSKQEVAEVVRMVAQLDANSLPTDLGPRTGTRIISMDEREMDRVSPMLEDMLHATGRANHLNVVMPEHRSDMGSRLRGLPERQRPAEDVWKMAPVRPRATPPGDPADSVDSVDSGDPAVPAEKGQPDSGESDPDAGLDSDSSSLERPTDRRAFDAIAVARRGLGGLGIGGLGIGPKMIVGAVSSVITPVVYCSFQQSVQPSQQDRQEPSSLNVGKTTSEAVVSADGSDDDPDGYRPAAQQPSVPGAPIEIRMTEYGIVLKSDDLDALDDMEQMIKNRIGDESAAQLPTFFFLKYRKAKNLTGFLEQYFGVASSGGGGGGGGGLMGGMMNNMLGGGTGDLLSGLLGGGGAGGTASAGVLEGEVRFGTDVPFNAIYVAGATGNDLDQIAELIDVLDQPDAPHEPDLIGQFRTIDILYRDPEEVKLLIEQQIPEYIETGTSEGGKKQDNEAAQMVKMLQQLQGGKKGGASQAEQEKPKARLGVDIPTKRLLVTGPDFIYQKILKIVIDLDKKELSNPLDIDMLPRPGNIDAIMDTLNELFPDKIELIEGDDSDEGSSNGSSSNKNKRNASGNPSRQSQQQMQQARAAIRNAFRQQSQQQRGRGGGRRGGGGR